MRLSNSHLTPRVFATVLHYFLVTAFLLLGLGLPVAQAQNQPAYTYTITNSNKTSTFTLNNNQSLYIPAGMTFMGNVNWNGQNCQIYNEGTWKCPGNVTVGKLGTLSIGTRGTLSCQNLNLNGDGAAVSNRGSLVASNCNTSAKSSIQNSGTCQVYQAINNTGSIYNEGSWKSTYFNNNYVANNCGEMEVSDAFHNNSNSRLINIGKLTAHELINDGDIQGCTTGSGVGKLVVDTNLFSSLCRQNGSGKAGMTGRLDLSRRNTSLLGALISYMVGIQGWDVQTGVLGTSYSYNSYVASGGCSSSPLPVELTSFTAKVSGVAVKLNWATASEKDNDYFAVERSADGTMFQPVAQVAGQGTTSAASTYGTTDQYPLAGTSYYRLKQVDQDGAVHYAPVVSVQLTAAPLAGVLAYPNPVVDRLTLDLRSLASNSTTLQLRNLAGQVVLTQSVLGGSTQELDMQTLPAGVYVLQLPTEAGASLVQRIVKQ